MIFRSMPIFTDLDFPSSNFMSNVFTVADVFCGVGGLSMGFKRAGFDLICSVDHYGPAIKTYHLNIGPDAKLQDVTEDIELGSPDVIIGGPPCQGFSSAGMRRSGDVRNTLVSCFAQIVARHRPLAFMFENVEGFLTAEDGSRVLDLLTPLIEAGYRIHLRKVNAANYGVPQHRKRLIGIGGLGWEPTFPEATHSAHGAPGARLAGICLPLTPTLEEALKGLPAPSMNGNVRPSGHSYRSLVGADLERAKALRPGQTMRDLPISLWHESYHKRANRRVMDGTPTERRGGAPAGVRRLRMDEPGKAITSGALAEFIHPTEDRNLTLRECARIQTFPDDFEFVGTLNEQIRLIGNAVPPLLATVFARQLAQDLASITNRLDSGGLVSFVPTLSTGMSPALIRVNARVKAAFNCAPKPLIERMLWD